MADTSLAPREKGANEVYAVIDGLYDLRALAAAGVAMAAEDGGENVHKMGRIMSMIDNLAKIFICQLDELNELNSASTPEGGAA